MKFLCPTCERLLELERFSLEGGALVVVCQRCGATSRAGHPAAALAPAASTTPVPAPSAPRVALVSSPHASNVVALRTPSMDAVQAAAEAARGAPFAVPEGLCPKCLAPRGEAASCPACGLLFAAFRPASMEPADWLRDGWLGLLRDWGNDAQHARLRAEASARAALPDLGRLYRLRLASVPDDPWGQAGRAEVQRMAQAAVAANLTGSRPAVPASPNRRWLLVVLALVVVASAAVLARLLLSSQG